MYIYIYIYKVLFIDVVLFIYFVLLFIHLLIHICIIIFLIFLNFVILIIWNICLLFVLTFVCLHVDHDFCKASLCLRMFIYILTKLL